MILWENFKITKNVEIIHIRTGRTVKLGQQL